MKRPRAIPAAALVAAAVTALILAACHGSGDKDQPAAVQPRIHNATVLTISRLAAWTCRDFPATVTARNSVTLSSKVAGTVVSTLAEEGALLAPGQPILQIDDREQRARDASLEADMAGAEADRRTYEAKRDQAALTLGRMAKLYDQGAISREEYEQSQTNHEALVRQVQALEAKRVSAQHQLAESRAVSGYSRVTSPLRAVLAKRLVDQGAYVTAGQPLAVLDDLSGPHELTAAVDESLLGRVRQGGIALAVIPSLSGRAFLTSVAAVVGSVDSASRSFTLKAALPAAPPAAVNAANATGIAPKAGMFGRLALPVAQTQGIFLPATAIAFRGDLPMTFVLDQDGSLRLRLLRLGGRYLKAEAGGQTYLLDAGEAPDSAVVAEVLSGLEPGERVAVGLPPTALEGDRLDKAPDAPGKAQ